MGLYPWTVSWKHFYHLSRYAAGFWVGGVAIHELLFKVFHDFVWFISFQNLIIVKKCSCGNMVDCALRWNLWEGKKIIWDGSLLECCIILTIKLLERLFYFYFFLWQGGTLFSGVETLFLNILCWTTFNSIFLSFLRHRIISPKFKRWW